MVRIRVDAPVRATEDPEKVRHAATAFVPGEVEMARDAVQVHGDDLGPLRRRIWELRIIDTMRSAFLRGAAEDGQSLTIHLAKQAAFAGRVSLPPVHHPLGEVEIHVELEPGDPWDDVEALAWWICPETAEGEIVGPVE